MIKEFGIRKSKSSIHTLNNPSSAAFDFDEGAVAIYLVRDRPLIAARDTSVLEGIFAALKGNAFDDVIGSDQGKIAVLRARQNSAAITDKAHAVFAVGENGKNAPLLALPQVLEDGEGGERGRCDRSFRQRW